MKQFLVYIIISLFIFSYFIPEPPVITEYVFINDQVQKDEIDRLKQKVDSLNKDFTNAMCLVYECIGSLKESK